MKAGGFGSKAAAKAFAQGIDFANSFYKDSGLPQPQVLGSPFQEGSSWYVDIAYEDSEAEESRCLQNLMDTGEAFYSNHTIRPCGNGYTVTGHDQYATVRQAMHAIRKGL